MKRINLVKKWSNTRKFQDPCCKRNFSTYCCWALSTHIMAWKMATLSFSKSERQIQRCLKVGTLQTISHSSRKFQSARPSMLSRIYLSLWVAWPHRFPSCFWRNCLHDEFEDHRELGTRKLTLSLLKSDQCYFELELSISPLKVHVFLPKYTVAKVACLPTKAHSTALKAPSQMWIVVPVHQRQPYKHSETVHAFYQYHLHSLYPHCSPFSQDD